MTWPPCSAAPPPGARAGGWRWRPWRTGSYWPRCSCGRAGPRWQPLCLRGHCRDGRPGPQPTDILGGRPHALPGEVHSPERAALGQAADEIFPEADTQFLDVDISSANGQDFVYISEGSVSGSQHRSIPGHWQRPDPVVAHPDGWPGWNIAVGGDGAVYMARSGEDAASDSGALVKWDVNGNLQWEGTVVQTQSVWERDLVVVNDGTQESVNLGGFFNGTFAPEGYTVLPLTDQGVTTALAQDGFVVRYDTNGGFVVGGQFVDAWVEQVSGDASGTYIAGTHYYDALGLPGTRVTASTSASSTPAARGSGSMGEGVVGHKREQHGRRPARGFRLAAADREILQPLR